MIDSHVHTALCRHAEGSPAEYLAAARERGVTVLAFTDHLPMPGGAEAGYSMTEAELPGYVESVLALKSLSASEGGPEVLLGIEADWDPSRAEDLVRTIADHPFDVVLGSIHIVDGWPFDDPAHRDRYETEDVSRLWERYFAELAGAARSGVFDVLAHPDLVKKFGHYPEAALEPFYREAAGVMAETGMAAEVNTAGLRKPVGEIYPAPAFLEALRAASVPVTVGSDAHRPAEVGEGLPEAREALAEAGYDRVAVFRDRVMEEVPLW